MSNFNVTKYVRAVAPKPNLTQQQYLSNSVKCNCGLRHFLERGVRSMKS